MKSFTPKPGVSTSRAFLASFLTCLMLVTPLAPVGFASTNNTQLVQTRSKSAGQQQSPPPADASAAQQKEPPVVAAAIAATDITATKIDTVVGDSLGDGKAQAGDTIKYTITINNNNATDTANGIILNDTIDPNTSFVAGTLHAQPVARTDAFTTVSNTLLEVGVTASGSPAVTAAGTVYDNDTQPNGAGGTDALQYVSNTNPTNGTVTFNSNGTFSYLPNVGYVGADSFTYTVRNNGDNTLSDTATVNITVAPANPAVAGSDIWYVDNSYAGANGASDGRSTRPFTSLTPVNGAGGAGDSDAVGDIIYLFTGNAAYTTGLALENTEQFIGNGVALVVNTFTLRAAGARPTLGNTAGNAITLAQNNTVSGLNTGTATGAAILGSNFGTATINNLAIGSGATRALDLTTAGVLAIAIDSSTSSGAGTGMNFSNVSGTLTVSGATSINNAIGINVAGAAFPTLNFNGGLAITSTAGAGIVAAGGTFNIAGTGNTIGSTGGAAVDLTNVNLGSGATFATVSSSGSGVSGLKFNNVTGNFTANGGSIATATGTDVDINSGAGNVTYAGSITNTAGRSVSITNRTGAGGTITLSGNISDTGTGLLAQNNTSGAPVFTFSGATKTFNTGANAAITLDNNDNATINFSNGGLAITTTTGFGFNASNGATAINVTTGGTPNTITSGAGTALSVVNSTIGASGLTFQSISASGAANGIVLNNTGASGGLTVTGTGAANTGGTIQSTTGDAISLTNTRNISFDRMNIQTPSGSGVNGTQVTNFTFTNSTVANAGNATEESAIAFNTNKTTANNIAGTLTITGNTLTNSFYSGVDVQAGDGTVTNATVSSNTITTANNGQGINFVGVGTATTAFRLENATINGNNISGTRAAGIQVQAGSGSSGTVSGVAGLPGDATKLITITNNSITLPEFSTQAIAVVTGSDNPSARTKMNFLVQCNGKNTGGCTSPTAVPLGYTLPATGTRLGTTILVGNNGYSDMVGVVNNNAITANQTPLNGGGNGIGGGNGVSGAGAAWTPDLTLTVTNNTIAGTDGNGILLVDRATNGFADLKITGNNVATPVNAGGSPRPGIRVDAGNGTAGENAHMCATISGNTSGGSNGSPGIGVRKQGTSTTVNVFGITGLTPNPATGPQVEDYLSTQNPASVLGTSSDGFTMKRAINFSGAPFASCSSAPPVADEDINLGSAKTNDANTSRAVTRTLASMGMTLAQWQSFIDSDATPTFGLINGQIIPVAPNAPEANPAPPSDVTPASNSSVNETTTETTTSAVAPAIFYLAAQQPLATAAKVETTTAQSVANTKKAPERVEQAQTPVIQPMVGGNGFPVSIGALAPLDSVTITFSVTVNSNIPNNVTQVSNQGQITSTSFAGTVLTDDPAVAGTNNPTVTEILPRPTYTINNASIAEPSTGSVNMPFTVTLSTPYGSAVSVDFSTADGTATAAGGDYTPTSGTLTFAAGQTVQTISVPVLANGDTSDETFTVTLSNPVNSVLGATVTATGTITEANPPGRVLISELRTSGPGGPGDDFIELYNNQDVSQNISGWAVFKTGGTCGATPIIVAVIPAATTLAPRGHYLIVGPAYSLAASTPGNATVAAVTDIEDGRNIGLFNTSNLLSLSTATREDAVGFDTNAGGGNNCDLLREGASLISAGSTISEFSFARNLITGLPKETNDNAADFLVVSTTPAVAVGNNLTPKLGAPGPENLASPIQRNAVIKSSLVDPTVAVNAPPNRVRSGQIQPGVPNAFGTLSIQRRFKNTLGVPVTRLRFRIVDITTVNNRPNGFADLRVLSSNGQVRNSANTLLLTVNGLTLEAPPQPNGGGLNSTLTVALPGGGLASGNSIDVQFLLGVQQEGQFSFFVNVEALPAPAGAAGTVVDEATAAKSGAATKQSQTAPEPTPEPKNNNQ